MEKIFIWLEEWTFLNGIFGLFFIFKNQTLCLDGDGSIMMHMGSLANIGNFANKISNIYY